MTVRGFKRTSAEHRGLTRRVLGVTVVAGICGVLAGCGGSSKPAYCSDRSNLESSVKGLTDLTLTSGMSGLEAQLNKIKTNSTNLVKSAQSDFPNETAAVKSSFGALDKTVKGLSSSPSASDIATVAVQTSAFVTSVKNFMDSTSSKCG
jgi:hypothetical protein